MSSNNAENSENKRKRLTQACELCRRKKIKCDGSKPNCGNCTRLNTECVYSKSMKKRGPRQGYIELLEQRLAKMEKILLSSETAAAGSNSSQEQQQNETPEYEQRIKRGKTSREEHHQHSSSPTSFSSISSSFPSPPTHALIQQPQSTELNEKTLPPMDVIEHITDLYFTYLHPFCPLFDEATLRKNIREGKCADFLLLSLLAACARYSERPDIKKNPPWRGGEVYADAARKLLIKAIDEPSISNVQGITLLTLHEYGCGRGPRSWMYGGMAIRMAMELGLHENIENDNANPTLERLTEQETSRKVFWSIYTIDKFSTAATGRPSTLTEPFCTALLPARVNSTCNSGHYYTESLDGSQYLLLNIGGVRKSQLLGSYIDSSRQEQNSGQKPVLNGFAYFTRASNVLGKVTAFVNKKEKFQTSTHPPYHPDSEISKLDKMIDDLYEDLPIEFKNIPTNYELQINPTHQGALIMLHILHNTLVILLHRPSMVVADTLDSEVVLPELKAFVAKSLAKCMKAVDNVTVLVDKIGTRKELIPPYLTYLIYTVATVVVSVSFSSKEEEAQKARKALPAYMKFLVAARNYWAMADKLYFMIRDLYMIHDKVLKGHRKATDAQSTPELYQQSSPDLFQQQPMSDIPPLVNNNSETATSNINDWNLSYYSAAMSETTPDLGFYTGLNDTMDFIQASNNVFSIPGGFNQPLGFSYFPDPSNQNNNNNNT